MHSVRMKKGFTLAELLIVVAIIAVLVAVAIPVFGGSLERAKEATCAANRRSLYGQVVTEHILSDRPFSEIFNEYVGSAGKCPAGGVFSWEDSGTTGKINCDYHDGGGGAGGSPGLHTTTGLSPTSFQRGAVISDDTGTCIILSGMWDTQTAYYNGATVAQLVSQHGTDAIPVDPSNIKDSSYEGTMEVGDIYYHNATDTYYYVTLVSLYESRPNSAWVPLIQ